jgi:L-erythro-3,5-diaminohexanoate dehydrogenase
MPKLEPGERVVPLVSLIAIPLRLEQVGPVDPENAQVPVRGRAILSSRMWCARVPPDLPQTVSLAALDVYPAPWYVRTMARRGAHVLVLGAGHAGLLAIAAAHEVVGPDGWVTAVDCDEAALERAAAVGPGTETIHADVAVPTPVLRELARRRRPPVSLTLLCTSVAGGEGTALVATASRGSILFFSTATKFAAAGLGADAVGSQARLIIPNGVTDDRGGYALELLRRNSALLDAFGGDG